MKNDNVQIFEAAFPRAKGSPPTGFGNGRYSGSFTSRDFDDAWGKVRDPWRETAPLPQDSSEEYDERSLEKAAEDNELGPTDEDMGTDVLAIYYPYSSGGPEYWGIWWNDPAMLRAIARISTQAKTVGNPIDLDTINRFAYAAVRGHELFHYVVEYTAAHAGILAGTDFYSQGRGNPHRSDYEEALASAWEISTSQGIRKRSTESAQDIARLKSIWQNKSRPHPYSDWRNARQNWGSYVEDHANSLGMPSKTGHLYIEILNSLPACSSVGVVPEFHVGKRHILSRGHGPLLAFLRRPTVEQVIRHAKRHMKRGTISGLSIEKSSKHPCAITREGKPRPITLDPVKWDRTPESVITQLADLFDLPRSEYLAQLERF